MKFLKLIGHLVFILILTVLTQIGGLIWVISIVLANKFSFKKRFVFPILYLIFNFLIIPPIAKLSGREKLPVISTNVKPVNWFYPLAFRNYVKPELKDLLENTSKKTNTTITYLDGNFPFVDGFPLLPHLSHNNGKKVDISFMYLDNEGKETNEKPLLSGYGAYVDSDENYSNARCKSNGYWQYDFPKYLTFGTDENLIFDNARTKSLIEALARNSKTEKIFIEPHLKTSLKLSNYPKIRFHGCQAVRHDDHIHLQIK